MPRPSDDEIRDEVRAHLDMATRERIDRGEDPAAAAAAARREFGNVARVQELTRDTWGWTWLERLAQDLRYALRLLVRARAFSAVAILSLALGIGVGIGLLLSLASARFAAALLFGVHPRDPISMAVAALRLGFVALAASYLPARAAARIEPTVALRSD